MKQNFFKVLILIGLVISFLGFSVYTQAKPSGELKSDIKSQSPELNPHILDLGLEAYNKAAKKGLAKKHYLTIIDFTKPSDEKRMWVIDVDHHKTLFHTLVSHGKGTGMRWAKHFSNSFGSKESSLGLYQAGNSYIGHRGYSMRLIGLEKGFNNNVFARAVVMHPAWYVSDKMAKSLHRIGRSYGCTALSPKVSKPIIKTIKDGSLIFAYYPDKKWLNNSKFL